MKTRIEIDGNDGTMKTTVVERLRVLFPLLDIFDRGDLTKETDNPGSFVKREDTLYIIFVGEISYIKERIIRRDGPDSLNQKYHTSEDLHYYNNKYKEIATKYKIKLFNVDSFEYHENNGEHGLTFDVFKYIINNL